MNLSLQNTELRQAPLSLFCLDDVFPSFEDDYPSYEWWEKYDVRENDFHFDLHSMLVPPSLSKPYRNFEPHMGPLWGAVTEALLTRTEDIYIVGYSLRSDDLRSHWLLRKASCEAEHLKRVMLVTPSDDVVARAKVLFHPRPVERLCRTLEDFATMIVKGAA